MATSQIGHFWRLQCRSWTALFRAKKPLILTPVSDAERQKWLTRDIPDRIRACLYELPMPAPWRLPLVSVSHFAPEIGCLLAGTHEGRMTAMRWLILFVGLKGDRKWRPVVEEIERDTDMRIDRLGGSLFPVGRAESHRLSKIWIGCSQATSHPTLGTNHPPVDPTALAEALQLIVDHLQRELYAKHGRDLFRDVMAPFQSLPPVQKV